ncbi:MAG: hypothetical protein K8T20_15160 [Planctomycetes bacterium]|nr:hypothetical protein [Planctomycetota bacterium]
MSEQHVEHASHGYKGYWIAWAILLVLTLVMINIHDRKVLLAGIAIKSFIISLWFMHLKFEKRWLIASVGAGFVFALLLFFFVHFDAQLGAL